MHPPATHFSFIINDLLQVVEDHARRHPRLAPIFQTLWTWIATRAHRFSVLAERWHAGTLPRRRPSRPRKPGTPRPRIRLPRGRFWLGRCIILANPSGTRLQAFLERDDVQALLRDAPQAGRLFRPLWNALMVDPMPQAIALPPRPPRPRTPPKPRPRLNRDGLLPSDPPLPDYVRAAVRYWKSKFA